MPEPNMIIAELQCVLLHFIPQIFTNKMLFSWAYLFLIVTYRTTDFAVQLKVETMLKRGRMIFFLLDKLRILKYCVLLNYNFYFLNSKELPSPLYFYWIQCWLYITCPVLGSKQDHRNIWTYLYSLYHH